MGKECIVFGCNNRDTDKIPGVSFHRIPASEERRAVWLNIIKRKNTETGKDWEPLDKSARICSEHFIKGRSDNESNPDYVPSLNLGYKKKEVTLESLERFERAKKRRDGKVEEEIQKKMAKLQRHEAAGALLALAECHENNQPELRDHNSEVAESENHQKCLKLLAKAEAERKCLLQELERLQTENECLKNTTNYMRARDIGTERCDEKTSFYTGLPSHALFLWLVSFLFDVLPHSNVLNSADICLLTLMKLRLNLTGKDLAFRLGISQTLVSQLLLVTIPAFARKLRFLVHWPEKEDVLRSRPDCFKKTYPRVVSIIDCTEVFIECPANFSARAATYSNYKHTNTIKYLVSIVPCGAISFVSRAFGGRASDKLITHRSGYLDFINHGDVVMADRGFLIKDELASRGAELVIPAFLRGKQQFSAREVEVSRRIANVRIHVERAMERLKNFRILSQRMPMTMVPHADSIMTVCAGIVNLHPNLVQ